MMRPSATAVLLFTAAAVVQGCGYTTSTALLPPHLKTIAIPVFANATTEYTLEQEITDAVIARFVADNHLKVVDERAANVVLRGKVVQYKNAVFGFSTAAEAQEYRVTIAVSVVLKDQIKNREMWSDPNLVKTANYYVVDVPGQPARTELDGRKEAVDKIAEAVVSRTVEGW
jgi:outer membrane lipopolysaccharide assembly protein LptE/RlpB